MWAIAICSLIIGIALSFCLRMKDENDELRTTIKQQDEWIEDLVRRLENT